MKKKDNKKSDDKDLKDEIEQLEKDEENNNSWKTSSNDEYQELNDRYIRLLAEFENFKRRTTEESLASYWNWARDILTLILPFFDNFKRATESCSEDLLKDNWVQWILSIEKDLFKELEKKWLKKINAQWEKFDMNKMEALMQDTDTDKDFVAQVFEDWYEFDGQTVRFAKVSVGTK